MPTEAEMLPKDKYTMFDRKAKRYRKGIHSTLLVGARKGVARCVADLGLQSSPSGPVSPRDSTRPDTRRRGGGGAACMCMLCLYYTMRNIRRYDGVPRGTQWQSDRDAKSTTTGRRLGRHSQVGGLLNERLCKFPGYYYLLFP